MEERKGRGREAKQNSLIVQGIVSKTLTTGENDLRPNNIQTHYRREGQNTRIDPFPFRLKGSSGRGPVPGYVGI